MICKTCKRSRAISKDVPYCSMKCAEKKFGFVTPVMWGKGYNTREQSRKRRS